MKRPWLLLSVIANLAAVLALIFIYPDLMVGPGPLAAGHAELATDCFACHAPLRGASSQRCASCHAVADIGLRTTLGVSIVATPAKVAFHQQLIETDCVACHSDHQAPQLTRHSRKPFSHELLQAATRERCEGCHRKPTDNLHRQLKGNCVQCHSAQGWKPATFDHDKLFVLDGDHQTRCETCHVNSDYSRYTCYGCHEHTLANVRAKHEEEGVRDFDHCVKCHRSADDKPAEGGNRERGSDAAGHPGRDRRERD